jgi:hypothetical protein
MGLAEGGYVPGGDDVILALLDTGYVIPKPGLLSPVGPEILRELNRRVDEGKDI